MNLIIETDLGHDPDDFFAILYLISVGVNIRAITIVPGCPDQVRVAQLIRKQCGLDFPIGISKPNSKPSVGGVHLDLLGKYGPEKSVCDGEGVYVIESALKKYPDCGFFVIGPCTSLGRWIKKNKRVDIPKATMQGGFCGYHIYRPKVTLDKFEGLTSVPTFNLNGDRPGALEFIETNVEDRRFIGKNVCHTILYNKEIHVRIKPKDRPSELFKEGMDLYLSRHDEKKFHDPAAAVGHLYPEVFTWVRGDVQKIDAGWGTVVAPDGRSSVATDVDYEALWDHICNFK